MGETAYLDLHKHETELAHRYGPQVHLIHDPLALTWLARLCHPNCVQPEVNRLITLLYRGLVREVINREFPRRAVRSETRMRELTPFGVYEGQVIDPTRVRQDHILMNRLVDDRAQVTGAGMFGRKIAGPVKDRILLFPDPMGATGSSLAEAIAFYQTELDGAPRQVFALNLIVTPEFIKKLTTLFPTLVHIYAYRLDRGLSPQDVLADVPGAQWDRERGLNDHHYIVPGAGGMGEIMNNALT